ncbi:MAG: SMP-30/gluconolactonase/LRE family protein [Anaerolineae bacterium]|nr:SMP-30/gluconolactonase/LRE family protein [Anaerolineae bacterium]
MRLKPIWLGVWLIIGLLLVMTFLDIRTLLRLASEKPVDLPFVLRWGSRGSEDGQFDWANDLAVDDDGNVYLADGRNSRVQKFDSDGAFLTKWGTSGEGQGQFTQPTGIAFDAAGAVYVLDLGTARVQKFSPSGDFLSVFIEGRSHGFSNPGDLVSDQEGNFHVVDSGMHRIQKFDRDGQYLAYWGQQGSGPGQFELPSSAVVDGEGYIYVADKGNERVQKFDAQGRFVAQWRVRGEVSHIAIVSGGRLYVTDPSHNRIWIFSASGGLRGVYQNDDAGGEFMAWPTVIAGDGHGNLFVARSNNVDQVRIYGYEALRE